MDDPILAGTEVGPAIPLHKEGYSIADYRKIVRLGEGTFGDVWKAERGGFFVALKILKASMSSDETQRELKSLETLKNLRHKYLLHTENFWSDGDRLYIEMELADGGTLKERLKAYQAAGRPGIPEDELLKYFTETAKALDYLHGNRPVFLHRDIKPANILLVQGCAKLADFGLLRQVTGDNTSTKTQGGTPVYMAPESIKEDRFSVHTDLFSFAVTYAELRQGKLPFLGKTQFHIYQKICQDPPELSEIFHPEEKKVLLKALEKDPGQRYSSCGEFVFELNRVVPWEPAAETPSLPAPVHSERGATLVAESKPTGSMPADAPEFGTSRKRSPASMPGGEFPAPGESGPGAPTANRDEDGTVSNKKGSSSKPFAQTQNREPAPDQGTKAAPVFPSPAATSKTSQASEKKETKLSSASRQAPTKTRKPLLPRILVSAVIVGIFVGLGFLANLAWRGDGTGKDKTKDDDGTRASFSRDAVVKKIDDALEAGRIEDAREIVWQNKADLGNQADELHLRIENKSKALAVLNRAEEMLKKQDFENCLASIMQKAPFEFRKDIERKTKIYRSARDEVHQKLVGELRDKIKAKEPQRVRETLNALLKFRTEHPKADWKPDFQELPLPSDLLDKAWKSLLAQKVVAEDCRQRLEKLHEYASQAQPDQFVLDPLYDKNLAALEALVKAHESDSADWDRAGGRALAALRDNQEPGELNRNLWLAVAQLEKDRNLFRFADLEALPASPADESVKKAGSQIFSQVLERLVKTDNYQWLPDETQSSKLVAWCDQRITDPSDRLRALKAECLVRTGANLESINKIAFPLKADWYGSYVHALVRHKSALVLKDKKKHEEAAELLASMLTQKPRVVLNPRERSKQAAEILRSAAGTFPRTGADSREFASEIDAAKAYRWLTLVRELDETQNQTPAFDDLVNLAFAAVKSETPDAGEALKKVANGLDKLAAADKVKGYELLAKAYRAELEQANVKLAKANAKNDLWQQAIKKSKRSQDFAYEIRKLSPLEIAADLNGKAVELEARAVFAKANDGEKGAAKFSVFAAALQRAKDSAPKKVADGFVFPVVVTQLEAAKDLSKKQIEAAIVEADAALVWKLPAQLWWQELRSKALVRSADARIYLMVRKADAKEAFDLKTECATMLKLYQEAKKSGKYAEKFEGEVPFKIGSMHFHLGDYKAAIQELSDAKKKLAAIERPYRAEVEAEITQARVDIDDLLNRKELKGLGDQ